MQNNHTINEQGFLLISSLFVLSIMIIIVGFYLDAIIQEVKVSRIINTTTQTYYLAEAGIQEAFWKLNNDASWKNNFETNPSWSASFTRNDILTPLSSCEVSIVNQDIAKAIITATSTISVRGISTQRVVQASVFKSMNNNPVSATSLLANQDINGIGSNMNITGGEIFANDDINLSFFSSWSTDKSAKAVDSAYVSVSSSLTATEGIYDSQNPPIPEAILMPSIDFDSNEDNSYKSLAIQTYTSSEFRNLLKNFPITTLDGITYVTGSVYIKKGQTLTINGALVADGSIGIGTGFSFDSNPAILTINKIGAEPSGLLSKRNITIGGYNSAVDIDGLIYAGGNFILQDGIWQNVSLDLEGAIIAQNISVYVAWNNTDLLHNNTYISDAIGDPLFSQILFINHWEEEY